MIPRLETVPKKPTGTEIHMHQNRLKWIFLSIRGWTIPQARFVELNDSLNLNEPKKEINYPWLPTILRKRRKYGTNYFEIAGKLLPENH
jgi:hypothetical protein